MNTGSKAVDDTALDDLVAALDPRPGRPLPELDRRTLEDLTTILASGAPPAEPAPRRQPAPLLGRWYFAVSAAAVLAVLMVLISPSAGPGGAGTALAATPPPLTYQPLPPGTDPLAVLDQIAQATATLPDDTGTGRYAHLTSRGWHLWTSVAGQRVTSQVVPQLSESWFSADGAGRTLTTVEQPGKRPHREDERYEPGQLAGTPDLRARPSDDRLLAEQLERGHPVHNGPAERLVAIKDTYRQVPVRPAVRAALLRYLADTPTLTATGTVTDRAGRDGLAVSLESDYSGLPTRYTLIIDPDTGRLLASEDTLTTTPGALNVAIPSVIGYTTFLTAQYTDRTD